MKEHEQSIITSSGKDNEIRRLTEALDYFSGDLDFYPKGSMNWTIAKIHLRGVRDRLEELGVHQINEVREYREEDNGLGRIKRSRKLK